MSVTPSSAIVGVFREEIAAEQAMDAFYNAGFTHEQIRKSVPATSGGFFGDIKNLFTGSSTASDTVAHDLTNMGLSDEEAHFYSQEHKDGNIILAIYAPGREQEAHVIMQQYGAYNAIPTTDVQHESETTSDIQPDALVVADTAHHTVVEPYVAMPVVEDTTTHHTEPHTDEPTAEDATHYHPIVEPYVATPPVQDTTTQPTDEPVAEDAIQSHEELHTDAPVVQEHDVNPWSKHYRPEPSVQQEHGEAQQSVNPTLAPSSDLTDETLTTLSEENGLDPYHPATQVVTPEPLTTTSTDHTIEPVVATTTASEQSVEAHDAPSEVATEHESAHQTTLDTDVEPHPLAATTPILHDETHEFDSTTHHAEQQPAPEAIISEYAIEHHAEPLSAVQDAEPLTTHDHTHEQQSTHITQSQEPVVNETVTEHEVQPPAAQTEQEVVHTYDTPEVQPLYAATAQEEVSISSIQDVQDESSTLADAPTEPLVADPIAAHEGISLPQAVQGEATSIEVAEPQAVQPIMDTTDNTALSQESPVSEVTPAQPVASTSHETELEDELAQLQAQIAVLQQQLQDVKTQLQTAKSREEQVKKEKEREQLLQGLRQQMQALQAELAATHTELQDTHARISQY